MINSILCHIHDNKDGTVVLSFDSDDPEVCPCEHTVSLDNLANLVRWLDRNMPDLGKKEQGQ